MRKNEAVILMIFHKCAAQEADYVSPPRCSRRVQMMGGCNPRRAWEKRQRLRTDVSSILDTSVKLDSVV